MTPNSPPIFILGISERCGTNFLFDLIRFHPNCAPPEPIWEDYLLHNSDYLEQFVSSSHLKWSKWVNEGEKESLLYHHLGNGLVSFLQVHAPAHRLLSKTPSVKNLNTFFKLFPNAKLLLLVRDGRAVAESMIRTFPRSFDSAVRQWAIAAETILNFKNDSTIPRDQYLIVEYEQLCKNTTEVLTMIFEFLGLSIEEYDFESATNLPVRGSSSLQAESGTKVSWNPVRKDKNFDPTQRASDWSRARHERFNWLAGDTMERIGYTKTHHNGGAYFWAAWNRIMDVIAMLRAAVRRVIGHEMAMKLRRIVSS